MVKKLKYFAEVPENVRKPCEDFGERLKKIRKSLEEAEKDECKVILFYLPIVSRTDIEAALQKLKDREDKYVAIIVLHHTFDPECIVPDSSKVVNREKTFTVDCLFHEDQGLLQCHKNDEAIKQVARWLHQVKFINEEKKKTSKRVKNRRRGRRATATVLKAKKEQLDI